VTSARGWEHRKPGGVGDIVHTDTGFTTTVAIPLDAEGYFGRECPSCAALFKMRHDEYHALPDELELTCPYCGHREDHGEFLTTAQRERVTAAAQGLAHQMVHSTLGDMLSEVFGHQTRGSSGSMVTITWSYTPGSPPPVRDLPPFVEEKVRRIIECSSCGTHHAVSSATSFCPVCGPRPASDKVLEAITAARQSLAIEDGMPGEDRDQLRALGVFERFAVDTITSVVSLFEPFAREQFRDRVQVADDAVRGKGNVFQRLDDTAQLFMAYTGLDLVRIVGKDRWQRLRRAFAQRHVLTHCGGVVDQRYLDQIPDATVLVGQRLIIRRTDAERALDDLEVLVTALANQHLPPA
jgi:hypothetical protein